MLKILIGIVLIAFTTFCGYLFAYKYRQRKHFFTQFCQFNDRFLSEISYYRRPIGEFIANYAYQGEFNELLQEYFSSLKKNLSFELPEYTFLKKDEKVVVSDYFLMLGRGDSASQKGYFSAIKERLGKLQTEAIAECRRYGDLYIKLGFLTGLLILLLIV